MLSATGGPISTVTFKIYPLAATHHQVTLYKQEALVDTIVCILNVSWEPKEEPYSKTLLLNALHGLGLSPPLPTTSRLTA